MQRLAIGEHDLQQTSYGFAALNRLNGNGYLVARLECVFAPAAINHIRRITRLNNPMFHFAAIVFYVITQETMRIGLIPPLDGTLHYNLLPGGKRGGAMVCG
jgi:phosphatidate phosphatase APP1